MTPETDGKTASRSEQVKVFITNIVAGAAPQAGRQDVAGGPPQKQIEAARRTYAQAMSDTETPLAIFLDFKHRKATRGLLITDRFVYSSHVPVPLPLDRICLVGVTGGGFTPEKLRINGVAFLEHRKVDPLAMSIVSEIRTEIRKRKLQGKLFPDDARRAALTNESHVRAAANAMASGSPVATIQTQLQNRGMNADSADVLSRGLLAMSEPGNVASGAGLTFAGIMCMGLVIFMFFDPIKGFAFNHIFLVFAAIGAIMMIAIGVQSIRSVKKRRTDPDSLVKTWLDFLDPDRSQ